MDQKKKLEIKKTLKKNLALEIKTLEVRAVPKAAATMQAFARGKGGY